MTRHLVRARVRVGARAWARVRVRVGARPRVRVRIRVGARARVRVRVRDRAGVRVRVRVRVGLGWLKHAAEHSRMLVITPPWYSYEPWEKFIRQICMPARRSMCSDSTSWTFGPIVQMIEQLRSVAACG